MVAQRSAFCLQSFYHLADKATQKAVCLAPGGPVLSAAFQDCVLSGTVAQHQHVRHQLQAGSGDTSALR